MAGQQQQGGGKEGHEYLILKKFKGVNTQPSREAIGQDEFSWLENYMPIGDAFIQAVPAPGTATATVTSAISLMHPATIGTVNYQICFTAAGGAQAVNLSNGNVVTITAAGTFQGTPAMDQWKSERIVMCDTASFYSWDGNLFYQSGSLATISVVVTGSGFTSTPAVVVTGGTSGTTASATCTLNSDGIGVVNLVTVGSGYTTAPAITFSGGGGSAATATAFIMPTGLNGTDVCVYSGRVWVANGRLISYTAPGTWYDVNPTDAAGNTTITEGLLRQAIYGLEALDNYLYIFADSSVIVIGDLKVTNSITTYSQTFLSSTTGSTLPATITAMERAIIFVNKYGVYALFGASIQKISKPLDGIFPLIDFTQPVSAGLVQIYNILCYVFSFTYKGTNGTRSLQAVYFDGKWFFTSQGNSLTFISPASIAGVLSLWGTSGTDVTQLYANTAGAISTTLQTGLYSMVSPIFTKVTITTGLEYTAPAASTLTFETDTESQTASSVSTSGSTLIWYNASNAQITWVNASNNVITWSASTFLLDYFPTAIGGKYLGATITSNSPGIVINGILMEYKVTGNWGTP